MNMKKVICLCVMMIMLLSVLGAMPMEAFAANDAGKCGKDVYWKFEGNTLTFYGTGAMNDIESYSVGDWYRWSSDMEHVVFGEGITYIGEYVLEGSTHRYQKVKTITIPSSVTEIGAHAFGGVKNLEAVYATDLESWCAIKQHDGSNPLNNKAALYLGDELVEKLEIPSDFKQISDYAFKGCSSLKRVDIPANVKKIGDFAFNSCGNLKEMYFYGNAPEFGYAVYTLTYVTVYYPAGNETWTEELRQTAGKEYVTWVAMEGLHRHTIKKDRAKDPTCTKSGLTEGQHCSGCGEVLVKQEKIPALGHDYVVTTVAPTCVEQGYDLHTCSRCGDAKQENETAALGHDLQVTTVSPTCTGGGWDLHQCTRCDYTLQNNETAALDHSYGEWETVKAPTVDAEGLESRKCQNCEVSEERSMEKLTPPPTQSPTTAPVETVPTPTRPVTPEPAPQADLMLMLIIGAVLLVAGAVVMLYLLRRKS